MSILIHLSLKYKSAKIRTHTVSSYVCWAFGIGHRKVVMRRISEFSLGLHQIIRCILIEVGTYITLGDDDVMDFQGLSQAMIDQCGNNLLHMTKTKLFKAFVRTWHILPILRG